MSAFNAATNSSSVSFTNAYGTAIFQPSQSTQYVYGFDRTIGKRYYELYINHVGGEKEKLWIGHLGLNLIGGDVKTGPLLGGSNQRCEWQGSDFRAGSTITASHTNFATGDTLMISVDFGGGTDHAGTQRNFTLSDGHGNLLLPVFVEMGQNNNWGLCYYNNYIYSAGGLDGRQRAIVAAEAGTSEHIVSLRVVSSSFVYAVPSGFTSWGDGPEGGGTLSATSTVSSSMTHSATITPSGVVSSGGVLWPYGVQT